MILILGGGFIGTHLYRYLSGSFFNIKLVTKQTLDYTNLTTLINFLETEKPEFVINCSGYTGRPNVDGCEDNKQDCFHYNVTVPLIVQTACHKLNIKHIYVSSGCIYSGYDKEYTEEDLPNFGIFNTESSFYSKTKHIFELAATFNNDNLAILRIRMPFTHTLEDKNYLTKIYKYENLINLANSLTYVDDIGKFVYYLCRGYNFKSGIYNVVNDEPMCAADIVEIFRANEINNPNWKIIDIKDLNVKANRSNCVLSNNKIRKLGFSFTNTHSALDICIKNMKILLGLGDAKVYQKV